MSSDRSLYRDNAKIWRAFIEDAAVAQTALSAASSPDIDVMEEGMGFDYVGPDVDSDSMDDVSDGDWLDDENDLFDGSSSTEHDLNSDCSSDDGFSDDRVDRVSLCESDTIDDQVNDVLVNDNIFSVIIV